jgi:hypothetical protein
MKEAGKVCVVIAALVLSACPPHPPFGDLSTGALTVQGAQGYNGDGPHMAVTARSKHYQTSVGSFLYDGTRYGAQGNDDGRLNPGETVSYRIEVANYSNRTASSVSVAISTDDDYITDIKNASGSVGSFYGATDNSILLPQTIFHKSYSSEGNFIFTVSPDTPPGHIIKFNIVFSAAGGKTWHDYFLLTVLE